MKKQIAILSTMYYPIMGAPSACIDKYVQALKDQYEFHIITRNDELYEPNCRSLNIRYFSSRIHELRKRFENNINIGRRKIRSKIFLAAINVYKLIQTQFQLPSAQYWEIDGYLNALEKLNDEVQLDVIIPVSNNFVTQLAALRFKKHHSKIKWIAFITDPFSENYIYYKYKIFKNFWRNLNLRKEQEIYSYMDYGMFTPEIYRYVSKVFHIKSEIIFKIEFALSDLKSNKPVEIRSAALCRLIYAGMFYKEIRNPEFALKILSQVPDVSFDMYVGKGECEDIILRYNHQNFNRSEYVDRKRYLDMIYREYDILVNVGNNASLQAPSKMLELISTGKPIINFYHSKDSQYEMIEKYPLGLNIGKDDEKSVLRVTEFCKKYRGKSISFEEVSALYPENNLEYQINILRRLIEQ